MQGTISKTIIISNGEKFTWNVFEFINRNTDEKKVGWCISQSQINFTWNKKSQILSICKKFNLINVRIGTENHFVNFDIKEDQLNDFTERIQNDLYNR